MTITHLLVGSTFYSLHTLVSLFSHQDQTTSAILYTIRLPRTITVILCGSALATAGLLSQRLTKNDIATPHVLGLNASVVFIVILTTLCFPHFTRLIPFLSLSIILLLFFTFSFFNHQASDKTIQLSLFGMVLSMVFTSLTQIILFSNEENQEYFFFWLVGGVNHATWETVITLSVYTLSGLFICLIYRNQIDMLKFDDVMLKSLGLSLKRLQFTVICVIAILTTGVVSLCGPIAFIGLITPHLVKHLRPRSFSMTLLLNILLGAILLLVADSLAKLIFWPQEIYVGVLSALIGSIFFFYILFHQQGEPHL